jgi:peptidoglycan-N-acetylglucosamine deacetylase
MPSPTKSPPPPVEARVLSQSVAHRRRQIQRRRVTALGGLALLVLLISIVVGNVGGSSHHRRTGPALIALEPRAQAVLNRKAVEQNRAIDHVLAYTPFVTSGGGHKREIALTFDDGPGPYTQHVVRVLHHLHAHATFFEVGFLERWFHAGTRAVARDGNAIGDHTERHPRMAALPEPAQRTQIDSQTVWMRRLGVPQPRMFRPPYGSFDNTTFSLLKMRRMLMVLWSVDSQDFRQPGTATIVQRVLSAAKPGAIVLMHDGGGLRAQTVAALPIIIQQLRKRHYKLVTVPELLEDDPPPRGQKVPHYLTGG